MRLWPLAAMLSIGLGCLAMPAGADDLQAGAAQEIHLVQVTETAFLLNGEVRDPADLRIKKGDIIRWEWVSGSHVILSGDPSDPNTQGAIFEMQVDKSHPSAEHTFAETGVFNYFAEGSPATMHGTITVLAGTSPVEIATWGRIKALFENP